MSGSGKPNAIDRTPWSRAALGYAIGLSLVEFAAIVVSPALFRALVVADAAVGWTVVFASFQGLRSVPFPPPGRSIAISSLATGHWLAAVLGAAVAIAGQ